MKLDKSQAKLRTTKHTDIQQAPRRVASRQEGSKRGK